MTTNAVMYKGTRRKIDLIKMLRIREIPEDLGHPLEDMGAKELVELLVQGDIPRDIARHDAQQDGSRAEMRESEDTVPAATAFSENENDEDDSLFGDSDEDDGDDHLDGVDDEAIQAEAKACKVGTFTKTKSNSRKDV